MSGFFEKAVNGSKRAGRKAKLKAEILLLDRDINKRKRVFGIYMYDMLGEITCQQDFYATTDETISMVRPLLLEADREIRALDGKKLSAKGDLDIAQAKRAEAFPTPAANWKEKARNGAKGAGMAAEEAKIKTKMAMINGQVRAIKEDFGFKLFLLLDDYYKNSSSTLSPIAVHSATDNIVNEIRGGFQTCRADIVDINREKMLKEAEIQQLSVQGSLSRIE